MCEPDHSCETSERDEFIIEKLKSAVSEIAFSRNKLQDENQKLLQELKMYQRQCQVIIFQLILPTSCRNEYSTGTWIRKLIFYSMCKFRSYFLLANNSYLMSKFSNLIDALLHQGEPQFYSSIRIMHYQDSVTALAYRPLCPTPVAPRFSLTLSLLDLQESWVGDPGNQ